MVCDSAGLPGRVHAREMFIGLACLARLIVYRVVVLYVTAQVHIILVDRLGSGFFKFFFLMECQEK